MTTDRDWQAAAEECLVTALNRAQELVQGCAEPKQLVDIITKVGELVMGARVTGGDDGGETGEDGDDGDV